MNSFKEVGRLQETGSSKILSTKLPQAENCKYEILDISHSHGMDCFPCRYRNCSWIPTFPWYRTHLSLLFHEFQRWPADHEAGCAVDFESFSQKWENVLTCDFHKEVVCGVYPCYKSGCLICVVHSFSARCPIFFEDTGNLWKGQSSLGAGLRCVVK